MIIPRDEYGEYILNRDLTREVKSWIQFVTTKIDTVSSKNVCFTIEFFYKNVNSTSLKRDTMILISYYNKHAGSGRGGGFSLGLDRCFACRTTEYIFDGQTARHDSLT